MTSIALAQLGKRLSAKDIITIRMGYPAVMFAGLQPYMPAIFAAPSLAAVSLAVPVDGKYPAGWAVFILGTNHSLFLHMYQIATQNPPTQSAYYAKTPDFEGLVVQIFPEDGQIRLRFDFSQALAKEPSASEGITTMHEKAAKLIDRLTRDTRFTVVESDEGFAANKPHEPRGDVFIKPKGRTSLTGTHTALVEDLTKANRLPTHQAAGDILHEMQHRTRKPATTTR